MAPLLLAVLAGLLVGAGVYTFGYARGWSYMTNDPQACLNCHVMREQYEGWIKSSHKQAAVCNDCHTPHRLLPKYFTKALNGFHHSLAFTTGRFPDDILITERNHRIAEGACVSCHQEITAAIFPAHREAGAARCTGCHRNVGHAH